tara:strand:- start:1272 stop:1622 length:351 start_codon:yes stop_codon:yes gene_type:complete
MNISYRAGLLTASFGRFFGRLTGNSIKEFSRGLTETQRGALPVNHNEVTEQDVAEFAEANQLHRLGVDDELAEPIIEFINVDNEVCVYTATEIDKMAKELGFAPIAVDLTEPKGDE